MKDKLYRFEVPCWYVYNIKAKSEKQARKILVKEGGLEIDGELCEMDERDYKKAKLIEVEMKGINNEKKYKEHS